MNLILNKIKDVKVILALIFLASIILRYILSKTNTFIHIYYDELIYLEISRSIQNGDVLIRNVPAAFKQILYSIVISPANFIKDPLLSYETIKFINCLIMSSALFPAYLLYRAIQNNYNSTDKNCCQNETGKNNRTAVFIAVISVLIPEMCMTCMVLSENLFYPLSLWLFYFVYKYIETGHPNARLKIIIILIALFFTKIVSIYFVFPILILILQNNIQQKHIVNLVIFIIISVFLYIFIAKYGTHYLNSIPAYFISSEKLIYIIKCTGIYFLYITFAFLLLPILTTVFEFKKQNENTKKFILFLYTSLIIACIIICSTVTLFEDYPNLPRIHIRYLFPFFIPFFALTFVAGEDRKSKKYIIAAFIFVTLSILFISAPFSGDSMADHLIMAQISHYQSSDPARLNICGISITITKFDIAKTVMLLFFIFIVFKIKQFRKIFMIFTILLFSVNNLICYNINTTIIKKEGQKIKEAIILSKEVLRNSNIKTDSTDPDLCNLLLVSNSVISDKVLETYLNKPYYFTLLKNFKEDLKRDDFLREGFTAVSLERGKVYEETHYIEGINKTIANISYVILGKDTEKTIPKQYRDITPDNISEYKLLIIDN